MIMMIHDVHTALVYEIIYNIAYKMSFCYISLKTIGFYGATTAMKIAYIAGHDWTSARPPAGTGSRLRMSLAYTPRRRERGRTRTRPPPPSFARTRTPVFVRLSLSADNRRCLLIGITDF